jgi:hypothetical protein
MSLINEKKTLITGRGLNPNTLSCMDAAIGIDNTNFKNQIIASIAGGNAKLPMNPGFELHPYKGQLPFTNQSKFIIGTFPPISYLIDSIKQSNPGIILNTLSQPTAPHQLIKEPNIPFFHGNISALWGVLLTSAELTLLNAQLAISRQAAKTWLITFLTNKEIYYDDIITSMQRKLGRLGKPHNNKGYTYEDKNLQNICIDEALIIKLITNSSTKLVCFTNGATFSSKGLEFYKTGIRKGFVNTSNSDAFSLFLRGCQDLGLKIEMQCLPHYTWTPINILTAMQKRTKWIFEIRISKGPACNHPALLNFQNKSFTVMTPFSPAAHGRINKNASIINYRAINGNISIADILKDIYTKFRNNQHALLYPYNV